MKKMIFALAALMVMTSCEQTLNDKVEAVVEKYMENSYGKHYEAVEFGAELDSMFSTVHSVLDYVAYERSFDDAKREFDIYVGLDNVRAQVCVDAMKEYTQKMDSIEKAFVPEFSGYQIKHKYTIEGYPKTKYFLVNPELTRVTKGEYDK